MTPNLIKCRVTITTTGGVQTYEGIYASTVDAVIDAQERVGMNPCRVSVVAL